VCNLLLDYDSEKTSLPKKNIEEEKAYLVLSRIVCSIVENAEINKSYSDHEYTVFNIEKADPGIIIGKHGHTLDAIQYILNLIMNKKGNSETKRIYIIDIDGYRKRREESLTRYAYEKAAIVKRKREPITLYFMNSIERRIVHLALKEDPDVITYSEGKEPYRRVIIAPGEMHNLSQG